jgi:hypothetical protein
VQERIAEGLGIASEKIHIFEDMSYLRIKGGKNGTTKAHADFYHFGKSTDLFDRIYQPSDECSVCKKNAKATNFSICEGCARVKQFPLYTAWISLGNYVNKQVPLLQFAEGSTRLNYSLAQTNLTRELPTGRIKSSEWVFPTDKGLNQGDMVLFNCQAVHMAGPGSSRMKRISLDVRFTIRK